MESIARGVAIYVVLLVIFRLSGKRSLSEVTTFDFVLLLIIGEATQQALLGEDFSFTNAFLVILTLVMLDLGLSLLAIRSSKFDKVMADVPTIVVEDGKPIDEHMSKLRVSIDDVLEQARASQGIERLDQIKYAVVERNGGISVIPTPQ